MQRDVKSALQIYEHAFSNRDLPPAFHPSYIVADAKKDTTSEPFFFVYEDNGHFYYHGFLLGKVPNQEYFDIQSPYGYGGPLATTEDPLFLECAWSAYSSWCKEHNILAEFIRFHPLAENWRYFNGTVIPDRQTVWMDLQCEDLLISYEVRARTAIRKAYKDGLNVDWSHGSGLVDHFEELYCGVMKRLNADKSYYFGHDYFQSLLEWEHAHVAVCRMGDAVVAMALFLAGNRIMEYHLSAATQMGRNHSATNLIIHEAALFGKQRNFTKLHLGGGTGNQEDNPLLFFKSGFSANRGMFNIGKLVHNQRGYQDLRDEYQKDNRLASNKVLFYRNQEAA